MGRPRSRRGAPRTAALAAALLSLSLPLLPVRARGAEGPPAEPPRGRPVPLDARPEAALLDCRSPTLAHETVLPAGKEWVVGDAGIVLHEKEGKWTAAIRGPGKAGPDRVPLGALPALLVVRAFGVPYGVAVRAGPRADLLVVAPAQAVGVPVGRETAWIVDTDRDGFVGSPGDGLVVPGTRTVAPWTGEVWLPGAAYRLDAAADPGKGAGTLVDLPMPYPDRPDHAAAWRLVNARRQQCGMAPLAYDASLEDGIRKHAAYCRANRYQGHHEEKGRPGYTPEGAKAGVTSVLNYPPFPESLLTQMQDQLHTLYHRSAVLAGGLVRSAFLQADGMFGMRVAQDDEAPLHLAPLVFPPHGMTGVPRRFHPPGEHPPPFDGFRPFRGCGTSVGVYSTNLLGMDELAFVPEIALEGPLGPVQGHLVHPGRAPRGAPVDCLANVALTPVEPLLPESVYRARARVPMPVGPPFTYEWEFTTGK